MPRPARTLFHIFVLFALICAQLATCESLQVECTTSYSQGKEEETVIGAFFKGKVQGVYVELGALDGLEFSNTMRLASCFGWSGLLIEASSDNFRALERNLIRRPLNITKAVHGAACPASLDMSPQFINITKNGGPAAGNPSEMTESQLKRWFHTSDPSGVLVESVPCRPMEAHLSFLKSTSINEYTKKHIDFLSLDVEGAEFTVLSTMDFDATQVDVISIELPYHNKKAPACREFLANKGFVECDFLHEITVLASFVFVHIASGYECPRRAMWGVEGPPPEHFVKSGSKVPKRHSRNDRRGKSALNTA
jgi:hypothetical protein